MTPEQALEEVLSRSGWKELGGLDASTMYGELAMEVGALMAEREREACAKIAEANERRALKAGASAAAGYCLDIAAAIRSRSEKT